MITRACAVAHPLLPMSRMLTRSRAIIRLVTGAVLSFGALLVCAAPASATSISFAASTTGCFGSASLTCNPTSSATLDDLTFSGASSAGTVDYPTSDTIVPYPFDLGTFAITNTTGSNANITPSPNNYFDLLVSFTVPVLGQNHTYEASLVGSISGGPNNTFKIDFSNTPVAFNFSDANGSGTFELTVLNDPTFMWVGSQGNGYYDPTSVQVDGKIQVTQYSATNSGGDPIGPAAVPEPASLVMLGTGLLGLVKVRNRKRNNQ